MRIVGLDARLLSPVRAGTVEDLLAASEIRALQDQPDRHRNAWTAGRLALKLAAGSSAGKPWQRIETGHLPTGQPRIVGRAGTCCSLSHSGPLAVAAVAPSPVGIDLERIRTRHRALLDYVADAEEVTILDRDAGRDELTTIVWTIKEAALKWGGWGLSIPLRSARIRRRSGPARVEVRVRWQEGEADITVWTTFVRGFSLSIASDQTDPLGSIRWDPPLHPPSG